MKITVVAAVAKRKETFFVFKDGDTVLSEENKIHTRYYVQSEIKAYRYGG